METSNKPAAPRAEAGEGDHKPTDTEWLGFLRSGYEITREDRIELAARFATITARLAALEWIAKKIADFTYHSESCLLVTYGPPDKCTCGYDKLLAQYAAYKEQR